MRLLIINGPNLNMLNERNQQIYGDVSYPSLIKSLKNYAKSKGIKISVFQSNHEGKIIDEIQKNRKNYDGYIINPGALTHYSYATRDAVEILKKDVVEIHISDITKREPFRNVDVLDGLCAQKIVGEGINGYFKAIDYFIKGSDKNEC